ncbi:hypothetical protein [Hymenobacter negativus]|uniref:Uncharacterized protein n=1 Tax=Hymenobacter negativus TaxID=2795026 RepID=A0ABS3QDA0_9BACT|nr:hypothetical protein [Hymenobacter negativus]MBO2008799.1 hypothetical protein [Hymenobacter negativus]
MEPLALQLVPNPARDQVRLPELASTDRVRLLDACGRTMRTGTGPSLSLTCLALALYVLQATTERQIVHTARLLAD